MNKSYEQILKSSSIIGGAQGINYLVGMVRIKVMAILLGPSGVGLVGLFGAIVTLITTLAQFGIDQSGVREVAEAHSSGDKERLANVVNTLRRAYWITGIIGWILAAGLAWPLSYWIFGSAAHAWAVAASGSSILIGVVSGGQMALLQGCRKISNIASVQVLSAASSTLIGCGIYAVLKERGIVPVIVMTAIVNISFTSYYSRRLKIFTSAQSWHQTFWMSKRLLSLGAAFMYGSLLAAIAGLVIRAYITREMGLEANGTYQAAWALSGMFAGFILGAMGTDFYPRLSAVSHDNDKVNCLVIEQMEIGILLALPGLLATVSFAPSLVKVFYSDEFVTSAAILPWLLVGVFGQVITFPLGFIQRAKGSVGWILISQSHTHIMLLLLSLGMLQVYGLRGAAWAYAITTYLHAFVVYRIARHLSNFSWQKRVIRLAVLSLVLMGVGMTMQAFVGGRIGFMFGVAFTAIACVSSLRGIALRLGPDNPLVKAVLKIHGTRFICGS